MSSTGCVKSRCGGQGPVEFESDAARRKALSARDSLGRLVGRCTDALLHFSHPGQYVCKSLGDSLAIFLDDTHKLDEPHYRDYERNLANMAPDIFASIGETTVNYGTGRDVLPKNWLPGKRAMSLEYRTKLIELLAKGLGVDIVVRRVPGSHASRPDDDTPARG